MADTVRSRIVAFCAAVAVVLALDPANAQQRWYEAYDDAMAAVKAGNWAVAEKNLLAAIERGPSGRSAAVVRYGMWRAPFYPEYYLALAYLNQGRAADALNLFRTVQQKRLVPTNAPEFDQIAAHISRAEQQVQQIAKKSDPPPRPPDAGRKPDAIATGPRADASNAEEAAREAKARETRNRWQQLLDRGRTELAAGELAAARKTAAEARALNVEAPRVDELVRDIEAVEARQRERDARTRIEQLLARGRTELSARQFAAARKTALEAQASGIDAKGAADLLRQVDLQEGLEAVRAAVTAGNWTDAQRRAATVARVDPNNAELASFTKRINDALANLQSEEFERAVLRAYFGGEYETVLDLAARIIERSGAAAPARAYFYAACSEAALALLEGPGGSGRLARARALFAKAVPRIEQLGADRKFISPQILRSLEAAAP